MKRWEHRRFDKEGWCGRCGIHPSRAKRCPPGFWMTKAEHREWDAIPRDGNQYAKYDELVRDILARTSLSNSVGEETK